MCCTLLEIYMYTWQHNYITILCSRTGSIHKPVIYMFIQQLYENHICDSHYFPDEMFHRYLYGLTASMTHWWLIWPNSNGYLYRAEGHSCIWQLPNNQNLMKFMPILRQTSDIYEHWSKLSTYITLKLNFSMVFYPSLFYLGVKNLFSLLSFLLHPFAHLQDQLSVNKKLQCWQYWPLPD